MKLNDKKNNVYKKNEDNYLYFDSEDKIIFGIFIISLTLGIISCIPEVLPIIKTFYHTIINYF